MKKLYKLFIVFLLLLEVNFFSVFSLPDWIINLNSYHRKKLILFLVILFLMTVLGKKIKLYFLKNVILFCIFFIFINLISMLVYNQYPLELFEINYYYWIILLYIPLSYLFIKNHEYYDFFQKMMIIFGTLYSLLLILEYLSLNFGLPNILVFNENTLVLLSGNGNFRIARPADFIAFSTLYLLYNIYIKEHNKKFIICLMFNLFYIFVISQTRIYMVAISVIILVLLIQKRNIKNIIFINLPILLAGIIIFSYGNSLQKFYNSFVSGDRLESTTTRLQEFKFFSNQLFNNVVFGRGFVSSSNPEGNYLNFGEGFIFNSSDIGLIGFLSVFGILGIIFLVLLIKKICKGYIFLKKHKSKNFILYKIICIYSLFTLTSTFYFDIQRILYLPLLLSTLEYLLHIKADKNV